MMETTTSRKPIRLWPAVAIVIAVVVAYFAAPIIFADTELPVDLMSVMIGAVLILLWWLLFSRAPWAERIGAIVFMAAAQLVAKPLTHPSIEGAGQGMIMYFFPVPFLALALVAWAVAAQRLRGGVRYAALVAAVGLALTPFLIVRTDGVASTGFQMHWRWTPTAEQMLLAKGPEVLKPLAIEPKLDKPEGSTVAVDEPKGSSPLEKVPAPALKAQEAPKAPQAPHAPQAPAEAEWPGFRGPLRDSVIRNVRIKTDWSASPPSEVWRRPVGPGWSSFSVRGDLIYTQEQRGDEEVVSCYRLSSGEPVWRHRDAVRFYESNGGAGPRATPTIGGDRVYAMGATGILNALDAATGKKFWSRNVPEETKRAVPYWGIASSPLIVDDIVIVAAAGTLAAYDKASGEPRWKGPSYGGSYSSPHRVTLDGVEQIVLLGGPGAISVAPADGKVLWIHEWEAGPIVQPGITEDGDILVNAIAMTGGIGTRRLHVTRGADGWKQEERWTTNGLKPYFNDFVVHKGHAYGFDGTILAAINLQDGKRVWKGGRYGNGQMVLLAEQDLLLVLSEDGELALVSATPDKYAEVAKMRIFESKTWNHPVLVGSTLLLRNGEEMAAFRLSLDSSVRTSDR